MNRKELTRVIRNAAAAKDIAMTLETSSYIVDEVLAALGSSLVSGDGVKIAGFGAFNTVTRKACTKSHPKNPGQMIEVPAKRVVRFKPYSALTDAVAAS